MKIRLEKNKISLYIIAFATIIAMFTKSIPANLVAVILLTISLILIKYNETYLMFPIFIFYYTFLGNILGMSVFRWYTFIFLASYIYNDLKLLKKLKISEFTVLSVYVLYIAVVMTRYGIRLAIFTLLDVVVVCLLVKKLNSNKNAIEGFFKVYVWTAIGSFIFSLGSNNVVTPTMMNGEYFEMIRNNGTFEDSNYMGFFYTIAIFSIITLKLFKYNYRIFIVIALYAMMMSSLSMTVLVVNIILWMIYLFVDNKINIKTLLLTIGVIVGCIFLFKWAINQPLDDNPISQFAHKIEYKLDALNNHDMDTFTTDRSALSEKHVEYYNNQNLLEKLIGFNAVNTKMVDIGYDYNYAAHNEYLDMLLNVGLIGEIILISILIKRQIYLYRKYRKTKEFNLLCIFMCKSAWILYAFTITMFLDYRFLIFYLL